MIIELPYPPSLNRVKWTEEQEQWLALHYPAKGKHWCAEAAGRSVGAIANKASRMGLVARGVSEAWKQKQIDHSVKLTGRKRPDQAEVFRALHAAGKLKKTPEQIEAISKRMRDHLAKNGHPRGALGMKHTPEALRAISEASRKSWANKTPEEVESMVMKGAQTRRANGIGAPAVARGSWKAGWREVGAQRCYFRSRWEANYARYLEWLRSLGEIESWEHEAQTFWFEGIRRGCVSYLPDFKVINKDGSVQWHEVKGWMDARSKTTLKRMAKYHPKEVLVVIREKQYREIGRKVSSLIEGWEA